MRRANCYPIRNKKISSRILERIATNEDVYVRFLSGMELRALICIRKIILHGFKFASNCIIYFFLPLSIFRSSSSSIFINSRGKYFYNGLNNGINKYDFIQYYYL